MPNTHTTLTSLFSDIADAIRSKTGNSETIIADNFPTAIATIPSGGSGPSNVKFYSGSGYYDSNTENLTFSIETDTDTNPQYAFIITNFSSNAYYVQVGASTLKGFSNDYTYTVTKTSTATYHNIFNYIINGYQDESQSVSFSAYFIY